LSAPLLTTAKAIPFETTSPAQRERAAAILVAALAHVPSAWRDMDAARAEVATFVGSEERLAIAAVEDERMLGWIGAIRHSSHAWELHPLVVDPVHQRRGCGTLLVQALESEARRAGSGRSGSVRTTISAARACSGSISFPTCWGTCSASCPRASTRTDSIIGTAMCRSACCPMSMVPAGTIS
jgi:GNAT superfamily N-acetyltransferase